jgi:N-acetylmuramoyl-L-alanine amidase
MFSERIANDSKSQQMAAGIGLALMVVSFVWWQVTSQPSTSVGRTAPAAAPFNLVVLDPGHGGQDSGAVCGGILEKDLTLDIAQRVDRLLQSQGIATLMTRVGDSYVSLADRAAVTNRARDCIFVSIHFNDGNKKIATTGIETYYAEHQVASVRPMMAWFPFLQRTVSEAPNLESESLAGFVQEAMVGRMQAVNRGTKAENFYVIANVHAPAVLIEGGFLSNKDDIAKLTQGDYREQLAAAISEGILRYRDFLKQRQVSAGSTSNGGTE